MLIIQSLILPVCSTTFNLTCHSGLVTSLEMSNSSSTNISNWINDIKQFLIFIALVPNFFLASEKEPFTDELVYFYVSFTSLVIIVYVLQLTRRQIKPDKTMEEAEWYTGINFI